jgi:hypothetical protein
MTFDRYVGALLAVVTVRIALNIAALITKVERRLAEYPRNNIISAALRWLGEAVPCRDGHRIDGRSDRKLMRSVRS